MTKTEFLGLTKRDPTDKYSREQNNENLDRIDVFAEAVSKGILGIPAEATGTIIALTDASENNLKNLIVDGSVEKPVVKIMGKNLLENSIVSEANGVTVHYEHGVFTANGTATASGPQYENKISLPAGVYTLSVEYVSGSLEAMGDNVIRIGKMGVSSKNVKITGKDSTQYTHEGGELYVGLRVNSKSVFSEYILKVQLELGDLATEWEDFKSQTLEVPYTLSEGDFVNYSKGVVYRAETQTETPLTAEELEAYKALHTNKPYTTITNSEGAEMSVTYYADTKLYLDTKFGEIQNAILSMGANI